MAVGRKLGCEVDKRRSHLAPVAKLQRALTQSASGDDADGIGGAAVDFDEGDQPLAILSARVIDARWASPNIARRTPRICPAQR